LIGGYRAWPRFRAIQECGWHHAYFETQLGEHPKATVEEIGSQVVLTEPEEDATSTTAPVPGTLGSWHVDLTGSWHNGPVPYREAFPKEWCVKPDWSEYAGLLVPIEFGFLVPWGIAWAAGWVIRGFQIDRRPMS